MIRGMDQANLDLGIFQETKIKDSIYTGMLAVYHVVTLYAPIQYFMGVAILFLDAPHFHVDAIHLDGTKVTRFLLDSGRRHWLIDGFYISHNNVATTKRVAVAIDQCPCGAVVQVDGNFNVNFLAPEGSRRGEYIVEDI